MEEKELQQTKGAEEIAPLLDAKDVARILKCSVKTVHKRVREGKLGCVQDNLKDRRFIGEQVQAYIEAQSTGVRVDRSKGKPVKSLPPKGGEKSSRIFDRANLRKEMSSW
ncbi:MAG: helix-turn-helix domain-containing protein [Desulfomonilaceae bacterium]